MEFKLPTLRESELENKVKDLEEQLEYAYRELKTLRIDAYKYRRGEISIVVPNDLLMNQLTNYCYSSNGASPIKLVSELFITETRVDLKNYGPVERSVSGIQRITKILGPSENS